MNLFVQEIFDSDIETRHTRQRSRRGPQPLNLEECPSLITKFIDEWKGEWISYPLPLLFYMILVFVISADSQETCSNPEKHGVIQCLSCLKNVTSNLGPHTIIKLLQFTVVLWNMGLHKSFIHSFIYSYN